jgi:hypothetical protein
LKHGSVQHMAALGPHQLLPCSAPHQPCRRVTHLLMSRPPPTCAPALCCRATRRAHRPDRPCVVRAHCPGLASPSVNTDGRPRARGEDSTNRRGNNSSNCFRRRQLRQAHPGRSFTRGVVRAGVQTRGRWASSYFCRFPRMDSFPVRAATCK